MLPEKIAQIQYLFFARNITRNQYASDRKIEARRAIYFEEPTTYDPLEYESEEVKSVFPYANIEVMPNGQILEAEQRFRPFGYELSSLNSECIVTQHFNTEKESEKPNSLKVEFQYFPSYEPIDTTDNPPFHLVATHTLEDHKVKNEIRIEIDRTYGLATLREHGFQQDLDPDYSTAFIYDHKKQLWSLKINKFQDGGNKAAALKEVYFTSEELKEFGVIGVPKVIDIKGPFMSLTVVDGEKTIDFKIPTDIPGSIGKSVFANQPMIPFETRLDGKCVFPPK